MSLLKRRKLTKLVSSTSKRPRLVAVMLLGIFVPLTAWSITLTEYFNEATVAASSDQFEKDTLKADNVNGVQVTPNAELIVVKKVINDDGGDATLAQFSVVTNAGTPNFVTDVDVATNTSTFTSEKIYVPAGSYSLTEANLPGYVEGSWSCTVDGVVDPAGAAVNPAFDNGAVTLDSGEQAVCTIINNDIAPILTLTKNLSDVNGGIATIDDFDISIGVDEVISGQPNNVMANTTITISEKVLPGYTAGTWACTDTSGLTLDLPTDGAAIGVDLILESGSVVNCEITNSDVAPSLTLVKNLPNANGGDKTIADFGISIGDDVVISGQSYIVAANTDIVISEGAVAGYTAGEWLCTDSTGLTTDLPTDGLATGETIRLAEGAVVTCEITNVDIAPILTLVKTVVNDNGGDKTIGDFAISVDGAVVTSGDPIQVRANEVIKISELDLPAYSEGTWACSDANGLTTTFPPAGLATLTEITLLPGSDVTCSITNNDLGVDLQIAKSVDDDTPNIGQEITFTLEVTNAGPDVATNVTVTDPVPAGFTYVSGSMTGGDSSNEADPTIGNLTWNILSVPVSTPTSTPITLTFKATVNAP